MSAAQSEAAGATNFIRQQIDADLAAGKNEGRVVTRFPPEPNGYLHIGHAKSICLNFGIARDYPGACCYLRLDDTNPAKERIDFVHAILEDVRWLGFDWGERLRHASDYFEQLHAFAVRLIEAGKAYVCALSQEQMRAYRGTLTEPGRASPYRDRDVAENLALFARMRAGDTGEGEYVLRAKIDMAAPNLNLRDPVIYRVMHRTHPVTGDVWCIYPMYDFAQAMSDAIEGVTHSLCTLEFEDHRPLYDWFLSALAIPSPPRQIEFSRLNLSYTLTSKRLLTRLIEEGHVSGWDDPRMPTIVGLRRRGYTPESIRDFCERIGVTKKDNLVDVGVLENCLREDLDPKASRVMCVLRPLRVVIENYPRGEDEGAGEELDAPNHPQDASLGTRKLAFTRELYIERDDFMEDPPGKFFRLAPGREVRLRYAYLVTCTDVVKDAASGEVVELRCRYDPLSRGGSAPDGRKVKGTLHWVSARHGLDAELRLYDRLFLTPAPGGAGDAEALTGSLNPDSLEVLTQCVVEPSVANAAPGSCFQFERQGYFCVDSRDATRDHLVFNRTATLRDSWSKRAG